MTETRGYILIYHYIDPPDVTIDRNFKTLRPGDTLAMTCTFEGLPLPTLKWMQNGQPLSNSNDSITITTSNALSSGYSTLQWLDASINTVGIFTCTASNNLGTDKEMITLSKFVTLYYWQVFILCTFIQACFDKENYCEDVDLSMHTSFMTYYIIYVRNTIWIWEVYILCVHITYLDYKSHHWNDDETLSCYYDLLWQIRYMLFFWNMSIVAKLNQWVW